MPDPRAGHDTWVNTSVARYDNLQCLRNSPAVTGEVSLHQLCERARAVADRMFPAGSISPNVSVPPAGRNIGS